VRAIAVSHPHFHTTMVEWARAFDAPVLLHADDRAHVVRPDPAVRFWSGETRALDDVGVPGLTLVRCGGHFAGSTVLPNKVTEHVRATIPRLRYDQLMRFPWSWLIPIGLINLAVTAVAVVFLSR